MAIKVPGVTGLTMLQILESRLDNVVFRLGYTANRAQARQIVNHGHFMVNGKKTNIPSYTVRPSMEVSLRENMRNNAFVNEALDTAQGRGVPPWLELDAEGYRGKVLSLPSREDIRLPIQEQLIVELYSR